MAHKIIRCPNPECRQGYRVVDSQLGRQVVCHCGTAFLLDVSLEDGRGSRGSTAVGASGITAPAAGAPVEPGTGAASGVLVPDRMSGKLPKRIGRFEIRERLGAGSFGSVYQAFDPVLNRDVALKVPHANRIQTPRDRERFLREAQVAARLKHPNIVAVYEVGAGEEIFIASEFIVGVPMSQRMRLDKETFKSDYRACAVQVRKIAEALDYAHKSGVIHRDVKPSNIMVTPGGEPMLMDFGLARFDEEEVRMTMEGAFMGTPAYMAPEQARSERDAVGPASDQYSLGMTLYEALCGELPFLGSPASVVYQVCNKEPTAPRDLRGDIPADLETICMKALSKNPAQRYASCGDMARDLLAWERYAPISARTVHPMERLVAWARREPLVAGLGAAVILLLLILLWVVL